MKYKIVIEKLKKIINNNLNKINLQFHLFALLFFTFKQQINDLIYTVVALRKDMKYDKQRLKKIKKIVESDIKAHVTLEKLFTKTNLLFLLIFLSFFAFKQQINDLIYTRFLLVEEFPNWIFGVLLLLQLCFLLYKLWHFNYVISVLQAKAIVLLFVFWCVFAFCNENSKWEFAGFSENSLSYFSISIWLLALFGLVS